MLTPTVRALALGLVLAFRMASALPERVRIAPGEPAPWERVEQETRPTAVAARTASPPAIDGRLDDACWAEAPAIDAFAVQLNLPREAARWVTVRLAFDADNLYLGARLVKPGGVLRATVSQVGGRIWSDDCLEVFFGGSAGRGTRQVDVNGLAAWWAGGDADLPSWTPALKTAATIGEKDWTTELVVPWADLGVLDPDKAALPVEFRYLVDGGAGFTAWTCGSKAVGDFGVLRTSPASARGDGVRCLRFRFPTRLPAGRHDDAVQVELENLAGGRRKALARLADTGTGRVTAQAIVELDAGERRIVPLPLSLGGGEEQRLSLLVKDLEGDTRVLAARRVTALPALAVSLHRERLWADDAVVAADVAVGLPPEEDARLRAEVWDDLHRVAQAECPRGKDSQFSLALDLGGLPAGDYRLRTALTGSREESVVSPLTLLPGAETPERARIPLRVQWLEGHRLTGETLLYAGISFPAGMLASADNLRVVDAEGRETPSQTEVLARWSPNGSVKWAGVRFLGRRDVGYVAEAGREVRRSAAPATPIRIEETPRHIVVETGAARFELPRTGPLIRRAWLGAVPVLDGENGCLIVTDQRGRRADETGDGVDEAPAIELRGPLCTIVRREGLLRTAGGERLGKYVVRLTFAAGSGAVHVQHTFINTESTIDVQYADIAFRVRPVFPSPWRVEFDRAPAPGRDAFMTTIDPAAGGGAYLLQRLYKHHFQPECSFVIGLRKDAAGRWESAEEGAVAGDWGRVMGTEAGVALSIGHFAQMFPKEIEAGADGLSAHLWSSRGGRLLDYRAAAVAQYFGAEWFDALFPGGAKGFGAIYTDATGSARTHDLVLQLFSAGTPRAQVAAVARLAAEPVLVVQDPSWLRDSDALGPLHPHDPEGFPRMEAFIDGFFDVVDGRCDMAGDYGFLDYGNGPHTYTGGKRFGARPRFYRYYEMDYQWRTVLWLLYARSGDRGVYEYAQRYNRHLNDFLFCWWPTKDKPQGALLTAGDGDTPLYWRSRASFWGSQGINLNNFFYQYYLTGDRRALDGLNAYADYMAAHFDPLTLPNAVAGANHSPYECLVDLYANTWDERLGRLLRASRDRMIDLETGSGLVNQTYYGAWYKPPIRVWVHFKDYLATGSDLARRAGLKWFQHMLTQAPGGGPGYQNYDGIFMNYAHRLTGDARYVSWAAERIARVEHAWRPETGRLESLNDTDGGHLLTFLGSAPYALDLIHRQRDAIRPWPLLSAGVDVYVDKPRDRALRFAVRCRAHPDVLLTRVFDERDEEKRGGSYTGAIRIDHHAGYFDRTPSGATIPGYAEITLPPEALAGEYCLTGLDEVMDSDAEKMVLVAPQGVLLPVASTRAPAWFFLLPKNCAGGLYATQTVTLEWNGESATVPACEWRDLAGGAEDRLVALNAEESVFVRFCGDIPPVLAAHDPARFFLPAAAPPPASLAELEDPQAARVTGLTGTPGDQALLLNGARVLDIPRGKAMDEKGKFELFDARRGTLEFWLKPQWTSNLLPPGTRKPILRSDAWQLAYEDGAFRFLGLAAVPVYPYQHQVLINRVAVEQGRWYHLALCWDHDAEGRIWRSELYVNGKPSGTDQGRPRTGLSRCGEKDRQFTNLDVAVPKRPLVLDGAVNSAVDELRVSSVPRYREPFAPLDPEPFRMDAETLVLMRFEPAPAPDSGVTPRRSEEDTR